MPLQLAPAHAPAPAHGNGSSFYDFFPVGESRLYWYDMQCYHFSKFTNFGWKVSPGLY